MHHMMMNYIQIENHLAETTAASAAEGPELFITDNLFELFSDDAVCGLVTKQSMLYERM